ncbi:MAG: DUF5009 domain-containing protein [Undibacterium sp.]|nr:DUF5009 domain-containing protein [Undibacterium sp.]
MSITVTSSPRFSSVDALRGLTVAAMLLVNNAGDWDHVYSWLEHATWHGCTPPDFIFPFFLLIVGVSLYLALVPKLEQGANRRVMMRAVFWRGVRIIGLGLVLHWIAHLLIPGRDFRLLGVLQRIGICFILAGYLTIYVRQLRQLALLLAVILLAYWALLYFGGTYQPQLNLADKIDTAVLGKLAYAFDAKTGLAQEPEGILSTLPALATVLMGVLAGAWLRNGQAQRLWQYALVALFLGAIWSWVLPLNKQLWTSSFVLWTGGLAYLALALAHRLIDLRGLPAVGKSFGVNAIAAYALSWIATCVLAGTAWMDKLYPLAFGGLAVTYDAAFASFAFAASFTAVFAVLMWGLRLKGWRISI